MKKNIILFCSIAENEVKKVKKWLIPSLIRQDIDSDILLYLINYTGKGVIYRGKKNIKNIQIREINNKKQLGFGEAHNFAFKYAEPNDLFFIINPDIFLHRSCLRNMLIVMAKNKRCGIVEARQLPFEHPKEYNITTFETPWSSGFLMLIKSIFFKQVNGFDKNFWMYCEDVDLSWRAWINNYQVIYAKNASAYHFTGTHFHYDNSVYNLEEFWSARNFLLVSYKYFGKSGLRKAKKLLNKTKYPKYFKQDVIRSFNNDISLKDYKLFYLNNKNRISQLKDKIKIEGFNQYHLYH
jgi:GT2 family glycosyltransferase